MSLVVQNLAVTRGARTILTGASFTAPQAAMTGLIGPNGAGKSTLLSALLGLVPSTGSASFAGENLPAMPRRDRARLAALVEQSVSTEERLSVRDVVALGRIPFQSALAAGMSGFAARRFNTLSGGEQQRVHIARALAQQPRLLLLDEPTSHLDIAAQLQLFALLRRRAATGTTVVLALHDLNLAARCHHLVVLTSGHVLAEGTPTQVLTPNLLRDTYGVAARLVPDPITGRPLLVYDEPDGEKSLHNPD